MLNALDSCFFLHADKSIFPEVEKGLVNPDADMSSWLTEALFEYLCLVDQVNAYVKEFIPFVPPPRPVVDQTAVPLRDIMNDD